MSPQLRIELPLLLPDVVDAADRCVVRLLSELQGRPGIDEVHVRTDPGESAQLCIHYDPDTMPLARLRDLVAASGASIAERYGHLHWRVDGIAHERRARAVVERLCEAKGVLEAHASATGVLTVEFDRNLASEESLSRLLASLNVKRADHQEPLSPINRPRHLHANDNSSTASKDERANSPEEHDHAHEHGGIFGANTEITFALLCGAFLGSGFAVERLTAVGWVPIAFYIAAYFFGAFFTGREALDNLRHRRFEIDTLMLVAAAGAAALGAWAEGALLLFLFSMGHALEHYAMGRAKRAIEALGELAPATALVRRGQEITETSVEDLKVGDIVVVKPDARLPADGFVTQGATAINQAPVTGESIPVDKRAVEDDEAARAKPEQLDAAHRVFAGTINGSGAIEIEVTRRSNESALAKVIKMVSEAEAQKSPTQRFTDRFERLFVPLVLGLATLLLFAWVVVDEPFRASFYRAMAVLVAASPCALAIATPSAVLSGVARAARGGVLIKGGGPLENLGSLTSIAFDKTGTLTEGRPRITDVVPVDGVTENELLRVAVAVESLSDHPLANAIARDGRQRLDGQPLPVATELESLTGRGVAARVESEPVLIGKAEMFGSDGIAPLSDHMAETIASLRERGRTTMVVRRGGRDWGAIGLMDAPRAAAKPTLTQLHRLGIKRMIMISGDHQKVADAIAAEVGLDEAWGDLMPDDKVAAIRKLRSESQVAMVGDGVNDAPAMANATVGIAMGAAGSDVALETADVALMADDLGHLPFAVGLSRHTRSIIRQNLVVSLGVVALLVPATILGLGIGPAVAVHEGSTLLVVFNALRLLAYRAPLPDALTIPQVGVA